MTPPIPPPLGGYTRVTGGRALHDLSQTEVVEILAEFASRWRAPADPFRREAEALTEPFPFDMVRLSLDALLDSLSPKALWLLIDTEGVRDRHGVPTIGHVIAGNTPLLAWTSLLRALLMRSVSVVKLPSDDGVAGWGRLFLDSLHAVSPRLASSITLAQWPGGATEQDRALCESVDLVLAYGSDHTVHALRGLCLPRTRLVGYGHRVSFGWVRPGADWDTAAHGLATDILLYDQGGCLSPQMVFVEGGWAQTQEFASRLAEALTETVGVYPLPRRAPQALPRVREARSLARMEPETRMWVDDALRWTVIARPQTAFTVSPTYGVVSVQPVASKDALSTALRPVWDHLQGCALADETSSHAALEGIPVSYICRPGRLQAPPLSWAEDGIAVLQSLQENNSEK